MFLRAIRYFWSDESQSPKGNQRICCLLRSSLGLSSSTLSSDAEVSASIESPRRLVVDPNALWMENALLRATREREKRQLMSETRHLIRALMLVSVHHIKLDLLVRICSNILKSESSYNSN